MNSLPRFGTLLLSACLVVACGGKSATDGSESPGGSGRAGEDGGGSTGGSLGRAGGGSGGRASAGGGRVGAGSAGGESAACDAYDDDASIFVEVLITNQTQASIHLGQGSVTCGVAPLFEVADAAGVTLPDVGGCRSSCVGLRKEGVGGCPSICVFPSSFELEPGETLRTVWDGRYRVQGTLPGSCTSFEAPSEQVSCDQAKRIEAGTFLFSARAGTTVDCAGTTGGVCPACQEAPNGGCSTPAGLISGDIRSTFAKVTLDERTGLGPAQRAAPNPRDFPGEIAAAATVELIFED